MSPSKHISIERAIDCLIHGFGLEAWEEDHLFRCEVCREAATKAASKQMNEEPEDQE